MIEDVVYRKTFTVLKQQFFDDVIRFEVCRHARGLGFVSTPARTSLYLVLWMWHRVLM